MGQPGSVSTRASIENYALTLHDRIFRRHFSLCTYLAARSMARFHLHSCRHVLLEPSLPTLPGLYTPEQPTTALVRQLADAHLRWIHPQSDLLHLDVQRAIIKLHGLLCDTISVDPESQHRHRHHVFSEGTHIQIHLC